MLVQEYNDDNNKKMPIWQDMTMQGEFGANSDHKWKPGGTPWSDPRQSGWETNKTSDTKSVI